MGLLKRKLIFLSFYLSIYFEFFFDQHVVAFNMSYFNLMMFI